MMIVILEEYNSMGSKNNVTPFHTILSEFVMLLQQSSGGHLFYLLTEQNSTPTTKYSCTSPTQFH